MGEKVIVLAGGTGRLGGLIATVTARSRREGQGHRPSGLRTRQSHYSSDGSVSLSSRRTTRTPSELARACESGSCVISALAGLRRRHHRCADVAARGVSRRGRAALHPVRLRHRLLQDAGRRQPQSRPPPRVRRSARDGADSGDVRAERHVREPPRRPGAVHRVVGFAASCTGKTRTRRWTSLP